MKRILIVLCTLLIVTGCGKKDDKPVEVPTPKGEDIVLTTPESTQETNVNSGSQLDSTQTKHKYVGYGVVDADYEFFIEGNGCIFDDYILARLMKVSKDKDEIGLEVGSHCTDDMSVQGGVTNMKMSELTEVPSFDLEVPKIYKLYYEFPEGFEPTTYLNYVDYATKLEEIK
ncbi:MAG: hypothetical protein ACK5L6_10790 [Anaerorhabdus sp.]|uniref:hypothetical protein n=1 Tax=Anaerorhabdus sp. TaxID=1872524 RepID=UPI003A839B20